ncbi:MAG TPA: pitrilysin family protein [Candidatus Paceibacterota bacterium]
MSILFTISNNLTTIYTPRIGSPNISISVRILAGSMYESEEEIGVAHFLEHIVFDGTEKYPSEKEISELIDNRGGYRNGSTNKETVEYIVKVLKEDIETAFDYLSQIIISPLCLEKSIEKEKKIIEQEIYRFKSDPEKLAPRLIYSILFPGTRLGKLNTGDVDDINKIDRDKILSYLNRNYCASNMVISICGDTSKEYIKELIEKYFGKIPSGKKISPMEVKHFELKNGTHYIEIMPNIKQANLTVGYHGHKYNTNSRESYAMDLISNVLSRGKSSRLVNEIREKRGLAYVVNSNNHTGRNFGLFTIGVGLAEKNIDNCLQIIDEQTADIHKNLLSEELDKAYTFIKVGLSFALENSLTEASMYSNMWCSTGILKSVENELAKYAEVANDRDFVKEVAKNIFSKNHAILIINSNKEGTPNQERITHR